MVKCEICGKKMKMLNNTHLKSHNMKMADYKTKFPNTLTCSAELREVYSKRSVKSNASRKGVPRTEAEKKKMSESIQKSFANGRVVHNKGKPMSGEQKALLTVRAQEREERYKITGHPHTGKTWDDEFKKKVSESVKKYAKEHREELLERATRIQKTKSAPGGYYEVRKERTIKEKTELFESFNFTVDSIMESIVHLTCNECDTSHSRSLQSYIHAGICPGCRRENSTSSYEHEINQFIQSLGLKTETSDRTILNPFEIDILVREKNIGIEFDGVYWHGEKQGKSKFYHITKTNKAKEKGIDIIHIMEDEWIYRKDVVKKRLVHLLGKSTSIYARKCKIVKVESKVASDFFDKNHVQGRWNSSVNIGLEYNGEIVSVMSFSKPNITKGKIANQYDYEMTRFASTMSVVGGASKMFKYFLKTYNPNSVISYSDRRWGTGRTYEILGFKNEGLTQPNYWYISGDKREHRFKYTKAKLVAAGHDPDKTEWEIMQELGRDRIWDCGHGKWVWKK